MPGFKGIEKIEIRENGGHAEARATEVLTAPFVRPNLVEPGAHSYESPRPEGLQGFLALGEIPGKELADYTEALRRSSPNDLEFRPLPQAEGIQKNAFVEYPPPVTGFRSLLQNVAYYFKAAMGGGLGGPMMIFGFLLNPKLLSPAPQAMNAEQFTRLRDSIFNRADQSYTVNVFAKVEAGDVAYYADELYSSVKLPAPGGGKRFHIVTQAWDARGHEPLSLEAIHHYKLYVSEQGVALKIQSSNRSLVNEIHQAFLDKALELNSFGLAREWMLKNSQWAGKGLLERLE
jgi:hypothetical protein